MGPWSRSHLTDFWENEMPRVFAERVQISISVSSARFKYDNYLTSTLPIYALSG